MNTPVPPISLSHYLFVYGSLRSGFRSDAYSYISQYFDYVGPARAKGWLMDNGLFPVGVPTPEEHFVIGELYKIKDAALYNYALMQLDDYEGVTVEEGEAPLYKREIVLAQCNGDLIPAWVYWYNGDVSNMRRIDTGDLLDYLSNKQ